MPTAQALTSGPTQPEVQGFQPAGTSEMVDLFSGDFSYNIPLFELPGPNGGYPFNLSYQAGITMDQEASWVGLGWTLQPGAITRQMRGLPDEFKGDVVTTKMSIDPNISVGLGAGVGVEVFGGALDVGLGFSVYKNSYKGAGFAIDGSVGFGTAVAGMAGGIGLGFSLDTQEGVGVNPSLSLGSEMGGFGLSAGYNSKQGLNSITLSEKSNNSVPEAANAFSSITLAHPGYTPQVSMPMKNTSLSATFKVGADWWGIFPSAYVNGFYNEQKLDKDNKRVPTKSYGYLNYQDATTSDLLDYNREKDGIVSKESPNLAIPSLTYDIYSVSGQGIGMMYRPMRNDYGIIYDQETTSISSAFGIGVDVGPALSKVGLNLSVNHSKSTSGKWTENNAMVANAAFQKKNPNDLYEPWYFKVHGESSGETTNSLKAIGDDKAVRVQLTGANISASASTTLEAKAGTSVTSPSNSSTNRTRKPRSQSVTAITNGELTNNTNEEMLSHFNVTYLNNAGSEVPFTRPAEKHHFAGYTALTAEGVRYVYAIPAYNTYQEEVLFSVAGPPSGTAEPRVGAGNNGQGDPSLPVSGTDKFLKKTEIPKYAHSFLLTSILGPDYVDVTNDGVTPDDLGYWVKFTYQKTTTDAAPYKWRDPYSRAHYQEGWKTDKRDDKGSFVYGEKEMWYLSRAETKSHIAAFSISVRHDGRGVLNKLQDTDDKGANVYQLDAISLYTRVAGPATPIKVTRFQYTYSLCQNVYNNAVAGEGKLTLKKLWFEYGGSQRGLLNPYNFTYNNESDLGFAYSVNKYDRWGIYKPYPGTEFLYNQYFPYAEQDPTKSSSINANAAAWSLKEILLPSGGQVLVDYESDDYAYVQQKTAMQMMPMVSNIETIPANGVLNNLFTLEQTGLVRFKLEQPIALAANPNHTAEVSKYLDQQTGQLYFKLLMNLQSPGKAINEYITGYADIDFTKAMKLEQQGNTGPYVFGSFFVKQETAYGSTLCHPFSRRAWQHLRTNQPELANGSTGLQQVSTNNQKIDLMKGLASIVTNVREMFGGFHKYAYDQNWGKEVTADKSWIRLNSPDKIKYGGGIRVKQITLKDQWAQDDEGIYGQVYYYTMLEGTSLVPISSGVAAYEPIVGGDENALHYAKKYNQSIPMRSDNNMFFEYPVNESYYPGPQVGYRKVTVMSLPSAAAAGKAVANATLPDTQPLLPSGTNYGTSGVTVYEFYTAKDFPVVTDETEKSNKQYRISIPVPLFGNISIAKLSTTQGYSIVTNDMHGKQKIVSNYRQNKAGGIEPEPISWVKYNYLSELRTVNKGNAFSLVNTLKDNEDGTLSIATAAELTNNSIPKAHLGQEIELFHDMRQFEDNTLGGGARGNLDIVYVPILFALVPVPIFMGYPNISKSTSQLRSSVTNKIIFRSGILESVEAFDGGSTVKTRNLKWDKLTGATVLTSVNNNFDAQVYNYTLPAYREYQGMGAAYQNLGLTFSISSVQKDPYKNELYQFYSSLPAGTLQPGDEIMLYDTGSDFKTAITSVIYIGNVEGDEIVYTVQPLSAATYECMIIRSGFRNQLTVMAGTISALQDPSIGGSPIVYSKTVTVPK